MTSQAMCTENDWLLEPERRLMAAVLDEALTTVRRGLTSRVPAVRREGLEAEQWIRSRDVDWTFAFENVCNVLEIDPERIRAQVYAEKLATLERCERRRPRKVRRACVRQLHIAAP
jgi:hypothetical protein